MSTRRALVCLAGALLAAAVLLAAAPSLPAPPLAGPRRLEEWWASNGTAVATFALVRIVGLALSVYLAALGLVGTIAAATKWSWADALLIRCATPAARRFLIGGGLVASLSVSTVGAANAPSIFDLVDMGPVTTEFTIEDMGAVTTEFPVEDMGPVTTEVTIQAMGPVTTEVTIQAMGPVRAGSEAHDIGPEQGARSEAVGVRPVESAVVESELAPWVVTRGDHLWSIAAATVAARGEDGREATIAAYWLRLIDENRDVVGATPDLIYPGEVIRLPS